MDLTDKIIDFVSHSIEAANGSYYIGIDVNPTYAVINVAARYHTNIIFHRNKSKIVITGRSKVIEDHFGETIEGEDGSVILKKREYSFMRIYHELLKMKQVIVNYYPDEESILKSLKYDNRISELDKLLD